MVKVGIIGIGFMGKTHFECYKTNSNAQIVAIADINEKKITGDWSEIGGNIGDGKVKPVDLTGIKTFKTADDLINNSDADLIDICLPTHLHAEYAIKALRSGKNVMCEKPIARTSSDAQKIITAWKKSKKKLMVGHCIRFWPGYDIVKEYITNTTFGKPRFAIFRRVSTAPIWSWDNWLMDNNRSGGCALDMHIHDIDAVTYFFGKPDTILANGVVTSNRVDHVMATYKYDNGMIALAEGKWETPTCFPFNMAFWITFDTAVVEFESAKSNQLVIYHNDGKKEVIDLPGETGWQREINYFIDCITKDKQPGVVTPMDAKVNLDIALKEIAILTKTKQL